MKIQTAVIAHPSRIYIVVLARSLAIDNVLTAANQGIAAGGAAGADTFGLLQEPDPHLEPEIGAGERANRTDVNGVERVIAVQHSSRMSGQIGMTPAAGETQHIIVSHFFHEADTSGTEDATFIVQGNPGSEVDVLWFLDLFFKEP